MPSEFTIDCPFEREDVEESQIEAFKLEMLLLYSDHAYGRLVAQFDYEIAAREAALDSANPGASTATEWPTTEQP
jgi:hypothetical protein